MKEASFQARNQQRPVAAHAHETQSVGFDMKAPSFQSESVKPVACHAEWGPTDCVCIEGSASCRRKGSKKNGQQYRLSALRLACA